MNMDRHLAMETFVRVVDTGSFSAAANQMRVGQPAVSKAIAQLEEWLGVRLLLRSTRGLTPTEAGMSFYVRAKRSIEEAEEAVLAARGAGAALSGKLRIATSACFGRLHIMRQLDRFLEKHPELEIDMVLDDRPINLVEEGSMSLSVAARWRTRRWWRESLDRRAGGSWLPQTTSRNTESPKVRQNLSRIRLSFTLRMEAACPGRSIKVRPRLRWPSGAG
jgi:DNA-binding transcriptional LysR family regulator